jgi:hypothetical protein
MTVEHLQIMARRLHARDIRISFRRNWSVAVVTEDANIIIGHSSDELETAVRNTLQELERIS